MVSLRVKGAGDRTCGTVFFDKLPEKNSAKRGAREVLSRLAVGPSASRRRPPTRLQLLREVHRQATDSPPYEIAEICLGGLTRFGLPW